MAGRKTGIIRKMNETDNKSEISNFDRILKTDKMESDIFIEPGDVVRVNFKNSQLTLCNREVVQHVPTATGESWIFRDLETNQLHYVSEGCTVTLMEKKIINQN